MLEALREAQEQQLEGGQVTVQEGEQVKVQVTVHGAGVQAAGGQEEDCITECLTCSLIQMGR